MTIEGYRLTEHFNYIKNYIPQPFAIHSDDVVSIEKEGDDYVIKTTNKKYTLSGSSIKKLVDSLGIKIKLFSSISDESDVLDLVLPAANKLFKCFSDCFVFYSTNDDALTIIDLNVNSVKGMSGTKYENGPSPWKFDVKSNPSAFTCFADFLFKFSIDKDDTSIMVKSDDIMKGSRVFISLFREDSKYNKVQPMLMFSSKFSNMNGFTDICPALYDESSDTLIPFPLNYSKLEGSSFDDLWKKVNHLYDNTDFNDYISREVSELAASEDTPGTVKNFIQDILTSYDININQPIRNILDDSCTLSNNMKPSKRKKFKLQLGSLIGWCLVAKHSCCEHCGRMSI